MITKKQSMTLDNSKGNSSNRTDMYTEVIIVSPKQASEWMNKTKERGYKNRPIKQKRLDCYARDMRDGNWTLSHQGIAIFPDGSVKDGQHRLLAIMQTGLSIPMNVSFNVPEDSVRNIDKGISRSTGDTMSMMGIKSANLAAACIRLCISDERAITEDLGLDATLGDPVTTSESLDYYESNSSEIDDAVSFAASTDIGLLPGSMIAFMYLKAKRAWSDGVLPFMEAVLLGKATPRSNAPTLLHLKLIRLKSVGNTRISEADYRLTRTERIALLFKTWNFYIMGKNVATLRWDRKRESFPHIMDMIL